MKRCSLPGRKAVTNLDNILKSRDITLPTKCLFSQNCGFSILYIRMWELDHKEGWAPKNWCFQTVVLEKTVESPLDGKEIQPVHPKGNPPWIFIGRTDAEAEAPILWPPDVKNWLTGKDPDAGKDWRQEEKGTADDEMVGWHHLLNEHLGLISFRIDWLDLLAVQGTLKNLLQHHSSKASIFCVQPSLWFHSHIYTWLLEKP